MPVALPSPCLRDGRVAPRVQQHVQQPRVGPRQHCQVQDGVPPGVHVLGQQLPPGGKRLEHLARLAAGGAVLQQLPRRGHSQEGRRAAVEQVRDDADVAGVQRQQRRGPPRHGSASANAGARRARQQPAPCPCPGGPSPDVGVHAQVLHQAAHGARLPGHGRGV